MSFDAEAERVGEQRQLAFMFEALDKALQEGSIGPPFDIEFIKKLHFLAMEGIDGPVGAWRQESVTVGNYIPPEHNKIDELMEEFIKEVYRLWDRCSPLEMAGYVMWRLNWIHPFVNGNGRTARALMYYCLCLKFKRRLPGRSVIELIKSRHRKEYNKVLPIVDSIYKGQVDGIYWQPIVDFLEKLLYEQLTDAR